MITFTTSEDFTYRLALATLRGRPIKITGIRPDEANPGLADYEVSFLRLLEAFTNGSVLEISYTGTTVIYKPGIIVGGAFTHNCPNTRAVGYFIEPLLLLAPFAKKETNIVFNGVTSGQQDVGIDAIRTVLFPALEKFGIERSELRIVRRGSLPAGGGQVVLRMPHLVLQPTTLHATSQIKITKIRGIAYSTRVSPSTVTRMIDAARTKLKPTQVETFIYSDVTRGDESGKSPGFGLTLVAETRSGWPVAAQGVVAAGGIPDDLGAQTALQLLHEVSLRGAVGRLELPLVLVMMVLGKEDLGRLLLGRGQVDTRVIRLLRDLRLFFGTQAIIKEVEDSVLLAVKGSGFVSASKKIA